MNASTNTYGLSVVGIIALALLGVGAFFVSTAHASTNALENVSVDTGTNPAPFSEEMAWGDTLTFTLVPTANFTGTPITYQVSDDDISTSVNNANIDSNGDFSWTPVQFDTGVHDLLFTVSDGSNTGTIPVTVTIDEAVGELLVQNVIVGGSATPSQFSIQVSENGGMLGSASSFDNTTSEVDYSVVPADAHTVVETTVAPNYTPNYSPECTNGIVPIGGTLTCTITNTFTAPVVTTEPATNVTASDAQLNGLVGSNDASSESFWVSLAPFSTLTSDIPTDVFSTPVLNPVSANGTFQDQLSLVTTNGITTGGALANLPAITAHTRYYYVAWASTDTWHPGAEQTFVTLSSDDTLSDLSVDQDTLAPTFDSGTTAYTDDVANNVTDINVTPTTNDASSTVSVNGTPVTSGSPLDVPLTIGDNMITVHVVASDTTAQDYTIDVTRDFSDLTALNAEISVAQADTAGATAGSAVGDYPQSSIDTLNTAITTAEAVTDTEVQSTVDAATATLTDAVTAFEATQVQFVAVTGLNLNEPNHTLNVSDTDQLMATVIPADATDQTVTYVSDTPSVATVDSSSGLITAVGPGTATITATDDSGSATDDITVNKIAQTITFGTIPTQIYADPDLALSASASSGNPVSYSISGTGCTASSTPDYVVLENAGSCTVVASQSGDATYSAATPVTQIFNIDPRPITVTAVAASKTYDGTTVSTSTPEITSGSIAQGQNGFFDTYELSESYASAGAGSGVTINPNIHFDSGAYTVSYVTATGDIAQAPLTISGAVANDKVYDGGTTDTLDFGSASLNGVIVPDVVAISNVGYSANFGDKTVGTGKSVTVSGVTLSGADAANYTVSQPTGLSANITPKNLTITGFSAGNQIYDDSNIVENIGDGTLTGVVLGDTVSADESALGTLYTFSDKNVGNGKTVTASGIPLKGADAGNYTLTQPTAIANITPLALTVSATASDKVYDGTTNEATSTTSVTGLGTDDVSTTGGSASFDAANVGSHTVTVSGYSLTGADAGNYSIANSSATASAQITAAPLTITANDTSKTVGDTVTFAGTEFTPSGLENGETVGSVTLTSAGADPSATVAGSPYDIVASDATGGTFDPDNYDITYVNGALTVNAAPVPPAPSGGGGGGGGNGPIVGGSGGGGSAAVALPNNGGATTTPSTGSPSGQVLGANAYNFTVNFGIGTQDNDVTQLQLILIAAGDLKIAAPTGYFGQATFAGVKLYQSANGITPVSGYVGPKTRAVLNGGTVPTSADEQKSLTLQQLEQELQALMAQIAALTATSTH